MKRAIKASRVDEFMRYHEDPNNYNSNQSGFDRMYDILNKYGTEDEDVDVVFERASIADQDKMIALIKPSAKVGHPGYAKNLYREALNRTAGDTIDYNDGILDAFAALFKEGLLNENDFKY